jgi:metal-responsive CopG/Arc/MetJ family transcriptional regulator
MNKNRDKRGLGYQRVIVSLPKPLVAELRKFASAFRRGNKSGFVADAVQSHIERLRKARHTAKLREAYAAAAQHSLEIAKEWEHIDDEAWRMLDEIEAAGRSRRK